MRTITFTLNQNSIGRAIQELKQFKEDLSRALADLVKALTSEGTEIAKMEVLRLGAFDTGELADSIYGIYDESSHTGFIRAVSYYAVFVEYGTGVVGAANSHPSPVAGWTYDHNSHGEAGWVYRSDRDNKFHWTKGQPSSPFMYNTMKELERLAPERIREMRI